MTTHIELPRIELARSRARALHVLFGDDETVRVGRYALQERIGAGGMGLVYRAFDPELERSVALKVLRESGEGVAERLRGEGSTQASLCDPDVVQVFDVRLEGRAPYLAMEFVEGVTLREWLDEDRRRAREILQVFLAAARVLARVHAAGLVHRDFKPENVIVQSGSDGVRAKLLDFGLALEVGRAASLAGTPGYMAPEVLAGGTVHPRADQFAFCVSLTEALGDADTSRRLRRTLCRGRSERASERWPDMAAMVAALERELSGRRWRALAVAGLCCGAIVAAVSLREPTRPQPCEAQDTARALRRQLDARDDLTTAVRSFFEADFVAWEDAAARACASNDSGSLVCLRRHAVGLESLLRTEASAPSDWMLAVTSLTPLRSCVPGDTVAFSSSGEPERALAQAEAALALGDPREARRLAQSAIDMSLDGMWAFAMARWILAEVDVAEGRYESARENYEDAALLAIRVGDDRVVILASCALVRVSEALGLDRSVGTVWIRQAQSALARRSSPDLEARVAIASGWHAMSHGDFEGARDAFEAGLELARSADGPVAVSLSTLHYQLGCALVERRQFEAATDHFGAARQGWSRAFGPRAPIIGLAWKGIGDVARGRGRHAEAIEAYERGRALLDVPNAPGSFQAATLEVSLADALYRQGRLDDAKAAYSRARTTLRGLNAQHRVLAAVEIGLGNLARDEGEWDTAHDCFRRARDLAVEVEGPRSMTAAIAESSAAEAAMHLGRHAEARALLRASIDTRVAVEGGDALSLAFPLTTLGRLQWKDGDLELARTTLERALQLRRDAEDLDPRLLAETRFALAKVYADLGNLVAAREHGEAARVGFDGPWEYAATDVEMVDAWLAENGFER